MSGVTELGYVGIGVKDLGAWKSFAGEVLGLEVVDGPRPKTCYLRMDYWQHRVLIVEDGTDDLALAGWRVAGPDELEQIEKRLTDAGVACKAASAQEAADRHVLGMIKLADPGGIPTEIFYGPRVEPNQPFYPGRRMHAGFVTGEGGMGHIVVQQPDVKKSQHFYSRLLGMRGSIEYDRQIPNGPHLYLAFMSCNRRQHSIAFGNVGLPRRIHHVMSEFAKLEDLGLARDIVAARQVKTEMDIGQHHNDNAVSFYIQTPSGWFWELGWGVGTPTGQAQYGTNDIWGHAPMGAN